MGDKHEVTYEATMTREQWRRTFVRCQITPPPHNSAIAWLSRACEETFEVAEVTVNATKGNVTEKGWDGRRGDELVKLTLSRTAVLGIKLSAITALMGGPQREPANLLQRAHILDSLRLVGPGGTLLRLVTKEAKLPENQDLEEDELDLEPKAEEKKAEAKA